jgi:hypothetical protein
MFKVLAYVIIEAYRRNICQSKTYLTREWSGIALQISQSRTADHSKITLVAIAYSEPTARH